MVSLPSPPSLSRPTFPRLPRSPSRDDLVAALRSLPHPSFSSPIDAASRLGVLFRPSAETVDATLAFAAVTTGVGIVATAAYTTASAVLPLALLRGLLGRVTP